MENSTIITICVEQTINQQDNSTECSKEESMTEQEYEDRLNDVESIESDSDESGLDMLTGIFGIRRRCSIGYVFDRRKTCRKI